MMLSVVMLFNSFMFFFVHVCFGFAGYGSLICPRSRAKTVPEIAGKCATPVVVEGVQRTWAKRVRQNMTAMGVSFVDNAECVGVLLPVEKRELMQFDKREQGYNRHILNLDNVHPLLSVPDDKENIPQIENCPFLRAKNSGSNEYHRNGAEDKDNIRIWVYVQQQFEPPDANHPILQSYVDVILRGCLSISEDFAKDFIIHTKGWAPEEDEEEEVDIYNTGKEWIRTTNQQKSEAFWVDDRHNPIYIRAEQEWSLKMADQLDELLQRYRPKQFKQRVSLTPSFPTK
jgi:hypothetical protein